MNHSLPLMLPAEGKRQGSVQIPWRIQDDHKRIGTWLYCLEVRERWDQWERRENIRVPTDRELNVIFVERGIYEG